MKNQISFMSGLFDSSSDIASVNRGEDLAKWLVAKAAGSEFEFAVPAQATSGWCDAVTADGESFALTFDLGTKSKDPDYAEWVITIDKARKYGFFGSKDSPSRGRLCDLIHNILREERGVREVQWGD